MKTCKKQLHQYSPEYRTCPECNKLCAVKARLKHKNKIKEYQARYHKERRANDPIFRLKRNLRKRLNKAIKSGWQAGSSVRDLGCSVEDLKKLLESKFLPGMTWENWGNGIDKWNIDHIIPLSSFDLTDRDQFLKACHYTNLQPLWWKDNIAKSDTIQNLDQHVTAKT